MINFYNTGFIIPKHRIHFYNVPTANHSLLYQINKRKGRQVSSTLPLKF